MVPVEQDLPVNGEINTGIALRPKQGATNIPSGSSLYLLKDVKATLAAAYGERGRFPNALETAKRALELATDQGSTALADAIRAQMRRYQSGLPYRYNSQLLVPACATPH
jgi:hypothetical protein